MPAKPQFVRDETGREIYGLRSETVKGKPRYYAYRDPDNRKAGKKWFGQDKQQAIFAFHQWGGSKEKYQTFAKTAGTDADGILQIVDIKTVPDDMFWAQVRHHILKDPALVAMKTGIPEIGRLGTLPPLEPPLSMKAIIDEYIDGKVFKHQRQYDDAKVAWSLFKSSLGVDTLEEIKPAHIGKYNKALRKSFAPRTQDNHLKTVSTILNYAASLHKTKRPLITNLKMDLKGLVNTAKRKEPQPKPWKVSEYHKMLEAVKDNPLWKAIFLTSLNLGLHGGEMCDLLLSEFDLESNAFRSTRTKTGVARVAYLWNRTVEAIREWQATKEFKTVDSGRLFFNGTGLFNIRKVNAKIRTIRKAAGLKVVFDGIRDLTRTAAGAENVVAIRWIMGHSGGVDDSYAFREVEETKPVLLKVEKAVFKDFDAKPQAKAKK